MVCKICCCWTISYGLMLTCHLLILPKKIDLYTTAIPMAVGIEMSMIMLLYHYNNRFLEIARALPLSVLIVDMTIMYIKLFKGKYIKHYKKKNQK